VRGRPKRPLHGGTASRKQRRQEDAEQPLEDSGDELCDSVVALLPEVGTCANQVQSARTLADVKTEERVGWKGSVARLKIRCCADAKPHGMANRGKYNYTLVRQGKSGKIQVQRAPWTR
jgi:hypothetical protein